GSIFDVDRSGDELSVVGCPADTGSNLYVMGAVRLHRSKGVCLEPLNPGPVVILLAEIIPKVAQGCQGHILLPLAPHRSAKDLDSDCALQEISAQCKTIRDGARIVLGSEGRSNGLGVEEIQIHKVGMPRSDMHGRSQSLGIRCYIVKLGK